LLWSIAGSGEEVAETVAGGELALTPAAQRRLRVLNATAEPQPGAASGELRSTFQATRMHENPRQGVVDAHSH
jgi:hypothetical protein